MDEEVQRTPVELVNLAVGGSVISPHSSAYGPSRKPSGQERLAEISTSWTNPNLILIGYGFNDARGGAPADEFRQNLRSLIEEIRALSSAPILRLGPYPTSDRFGHGEEWSHASKDVLRSFAIGIDAVANETGCLRADVLTPLLHDRGLLASDGVHPNDAGHLLIAMSVYQTLAMIPSNASDESSLTSLSDN